MMKVMRLYGVRDLRLSNEPPPVSSEGEELMHVKAVGICGSDLHWYTTSGIGDDQLNHPLILGHEFSGITQSGLRVAVDPAIPCRTCEQCITDNSNLCEMVKFAGHGSIDGALCQQLTWDVQNLFPIPDSMTYADAAMLEPLGVALHSLDLAHLKTGMTVGIYGCGPIGLLILQLARLSGASTIIATDKRIHRLEAAKALGATKTFLAEGGSELSGIMAATGKRGVDIAFEVAGENDAVDIAIESVIPGGKVILVGIPSNNQTSFVASTARRKGLTIKMVRRMKNTYPRAIALVSSKLIDVQSLISHRFPLEKANEAFQFAEQRNGIKIMIEM
jgi:L-iditol 2-dehydrogenase